MTRGSRTPDVSPQTDQDTDPAGTGREATRLPGETVLVVRPLTYLAEGDDVTVGCTESDSYIVLQADGAMLLRRLAGGATLDEAADWYRRAYGEQVDVMEFADALGRLGFLRPGDDVLKTPDPRPAPVRWQRLGRALFSPVGLLCMVCTVAAWIAVMVRTPSLAPTNHDIFFTRYISVIEIVIFLGQFPLLLIHESFHALAGRRLGLRSQLSFGRRLYYIVILTAMDGLVTVPRRKRYLPMLAGLLADALVAAILTLTAAALSGPGGQLDLPARICLALAYTTVLRMLWQAYFYLETDLYHVVATVCGCVQLQATARAMLRNRWYRFRRRHDKLTDPASWHARDRAIARWYSWFVLAGYIFSTVSLAVVAAPVTLRVLTTVGGRVIHPAGQNLRGLTDSAVFLALNAGQLLILAWLMHRERSAARADSMPATPSPRRSRELTGPTQGGSSA